MTNLPHLWFLHSLPHPLPKGRALCVCACTQCFWFIVLVFVVGVFFNFRVYYMHVTLHLEQRDTWFYLNFWLCYLHITECNLHSLPFLFVSEHATLLLFHKDTQQVAAKYKKDQPSQRKSMEW